MVVSSSEIDAPIPGTLVGRWLPNRSASPWGKQTRDYRTVAAARESKLGNILKNCHGLEPAKFVVRKAHVEQRLRLGWVAPGIPCRAFEKLRIINLAFRWSPPKVNGAVSLLLPRMFLSLLPDPRMPRHLTKIAFL
jgi:hypothetical protein